MYFLNNALTKKQKQPTYQPNIFELKAINQKQSRYLNYLN